MLRTFVHCSRRYWQTNQEDIITFFFIFQRITSLNKHTENKPRGYKMHLTSWNYNLPCTDGFLPSSSSSDVMDLERMAMDRAVEGALRGGVGTATTQKSRGVFRVVFWTLQIKIEWIELTLFPIPSDKKIISALCHKPIFLREHSVTLHHPEQAPDERTTVYS
jgi:hypothetical protein